MTQWIIPPKFPFRGVVFDMDGLMIGTEKSLLPGKIWRGFPFARVSGRISSGL